MPEGDSLRRAAARLDEALAGRVLVRAELRWPGVAAVDLVGRTVLHTRPYGKHLLTRFDDGRTLHTHLRMDGRWRVGPTDAPAAAGRSPDVRVLLANETWTALGTLLGMVDLVPTRQEHRLVGHLGPDVLDDTFDRAPSDGGFTTNAPTSTRPGTPGGRPGGGPGPVRSREVDPSSGLAEAVERWRAQGATAVGEVLLDQRVVAGLGTVFMAETLFVERTWPWTPADQTDPVRLLRTARALMQESLRSGRMPGEVHGREGQPCRRCGTAVTRGMVRRPPQQRPAFWCPRCQPAPC